jgi:hypothetical protein
MHTNFINSRNRVAALARQILADRKPSTTTTQQMTCFTCGRPHTKGDGRFCSPRCRSGFDLGLPPFEPLDLDKFYSRRKGATGFIVTCPSCRRDFDSRGWKHCSDQCRRQDRERQDNTALMAEAEMERPTKRRCEGCGGSIPRWRDGRQVSKATRFCSSRCRDRHRRNAEMASDSPQPDLPRETAKKCPENGASRTDSRKGSPQSEARISGTTGQAARS